MNSRDAGADGKRESCLRERPLNGRNYGHHVEVVVVPQMGNAENPAAVLVLPPRDCDSILDLQVSVELFPVDPLGDQTGVTALDGWSAKSLSPIALTPERNPRASRS